MESVVLMRNGRLFKILGSISCLMFKCLKREGGFSFVDAGKEKLLPISERSLD